MLGIDPGTRFLGLCLTEILNDKINKISAITVNVEKLDMNETIKSKYGESTSRIYAVCDLLKKYISDNEVDMVVIETPYFDFKRPVAFGILTQLFTMIRNVIITDFPYLPFLLLQPSLVKMAVGATAHDKKDKVRESVKNNKEITEKIDITDLDDDAIDAIAITYAMFCFITKEKS